MNKTNIAWTDYSWNPWQGCKKISHACDNCYMFTDKKRYGQKGSNIILSAEATFNKPLKIQEIGVKVFTCSWSDFFLEEADEWRDYAWDVIRETPHLIYQILTKRPENIKDRLPSDWDVNFKHVWLGVTAENQEQANIRIPMLLDISASIRFVSVEPMLGEILLQEIKKDQEFTGCLGLRTLSGKDYFGKEINKLDWIIVGGESGAKSKVRQMKPEWVQKIYDDCKNSGVPFFFKQWGAHKPKYNSNFELVQQFPS